MIRSPSSLLDITTTASGPPLSMGLSPIGIAASFAAPEPYERLSRIRLPPWMSDEEGCSSYTAPFLAHSISPRCVGRVWNETMFSLARAIFSPGSAEACSSLFVWFIDTMARSDSSRACVSALWLCTFADRPPSLSGRGSFPFGPRRSRGLPVLVHVVSQRARVLRLRRTDCSLAFIANNRVAFLQSGESRRPGFAFFEAQ